MEEVAYKYGAPKLKPPYPHKKLLVMIEGVMKETMKKTG